MTIPRDLIRSEPGLNGWCILAAYRGSIAHGTYEPNTEPGSFDDKDAIAVCVPPLDHYFGLRQYGSRGTKEIARDPWDIVIYEAKKAIGLLAKGNPNVLSMLWLDENYYIRREPAGRLLIDNRDAFAARAVYQSFAGYARGQLMKLDGSTGKPIREVAYLAGIFDGEGHLSIVCTRPRKSGQAPIYRLEVGVTNTDRDVIGRLLDRWEGQVEVGEGGGWNKREVYRWRLHGSKAAQFLRDVHQFLVIKRRQAEIGLTFQHEQQSRRKGPLQPQEVDRREELRQALANAREDKTLPVPDSEREILSDGPARFDTAYMGEKRRALVEQHGYDTKNASHLIRLLRMGIEFLRDGQLQVTRHDAAELLAIKHGEWPLDRVKSEAEHLFRLAEEAHLRSTLPIRPDQDRINELAVAVVETAQPGLAA